MKENVGNKALLILATCLCLLIGFGGAMSFIGAKAREAAPESGWTRYEAENGKIMGAWGGRFEENASSASNGRAWVDVDGMGATLLLKVTVSDMGMYPVRLLGATDHDNPSMLLWNEDGYCAELVLKSKPGWGNYSENIYAEGEIPLNAGVNTLLLRKGSNAFQVDALDIGAKSGNYVLPGKESARGTVAGDVTKYEAEYAKYVAANVPKDSSPTSSGAYVSEMDYDTSKINLAVYVEEDGEYDVKIRYSSDQAEQNLSLYVDGIFAAHAVSDGSTGGWDVFTKDMTAKLMLKAGYNTVDISKGDVGNACVDYITVSNAKTASEYAPYTPSADKHSNLPEAGWTRFEAENAVTNKYDMINQGIYSIENRGNTGYGYISDAHHADTQVTFNIPNIPQDGEYAVKLRYASKNATTSFVCTVNDGATVNFTSTSNVDSQDTFVAANTITANVTLTEGNNTLKFTQGVSDGAANMEQFDGIEVNYVMSSVGIDTSKVKTTLAKGIDSLDTSSVTAIKTTSDKRVEALNDRITVSIVDSINQPVASLGQDAAVGVYKVTFTAGGESTEISVTVAAVTASANIDAVTTAFEKTDSLTAAVVNAEIEKAVFEVTANNQKQSYTYSQNKWSYAIKKDAQSVNELNIGIYTVELSLTGTTVKSSFEISVYQAKSAVASTEGLTLNLDYGKKVSDLEALIKGAKLKVTVNNGVEDSTKDYAFASGAWTYSVAKNSQNVVLTDKNKVLESGSYTVTLTYANKTDITASFTVTVAENITPSSIKLNKTKIDLTVGDTLDLSGISVTLVNSDNSEEALTAAAFDVDSSKVDMSKAGTYEVTYTYKDDPTISVKLSVEVKDKAIEDESGCSSFAGGGMIGGSMTLVIAALAAALVVRKKKNNKA